MMRPLCWLMLACAGPAWAQDLPAPATPVASEVTEGATGAAPTGLLEVRTNGFLDLRQAYTAVTTEHLAPANDVPRWQLLSEANVQLKFRWGDRGEGLADASFVYQRGGGYQGLDPDGKQVRLADHDVPGLRPMAVVSELYATWHLHEHLHLTLGKKRVVWGPGLTLNPTDLLNPPKDPSDPTLQRAGAWLARVEAPFETWTLSGIAAAKVTAQWSGVPQALVWQPDFAAQSDHRPHFLTGLRAYKLWLDTDWNAEWYLTQLYSDNFEWKHRFGMSASHVFWESVELHVEALAQAGSARRQIDAGCVADLSAVLGCMAQGRAPFGYPNLDDGQWRTRVLAGARYMFGDAGSLTAEYLYQGDGDTQAELGPYVQALQVFEIG